MPGNNTAQNNSNTDTSNPLLDYLRSATEFNLMRLEPENLGIYAPENEAEEKFLEILENDYETALEALEKGFDRKYFFDEANSYMDMFLDMAKEYGIDPSEMRLEGIVDIVEAEQDFYRTLYENYMNYLTESFQFYKEMREKNLGIDEESIQEIADEYQDEIDSGNMTIMEVAKESGFLDALLGNTSKN